jgi:hypothetical protein
VEVAPSGPRMESLTPHYTTPIVTPGAGCTSLSAGWNREAVHAPAQDGVRLRHFGATKRPVVRPCCSVPGPLFTGPVAVGSLQGEAPVSKVGAFLF